MKDVRALVLVKLEDQWESGKEPLCSLIAMKALSSLVYGVAGGTGTVIEILLGFLSPNHPLQKLEEVGCKLAPDGSGITLLWGRRRRGTVLLFWQLQKF